MVRHNIFPQFLSRIEIKKSHEKLYLAFLNIKKHEWKVELKS